MLDARSEAEQAVADLRAAGALDGAAPAAERDGQAAIRTTGGGAAAGEERDGMLGPARTLLFRDNG